MKTEPVKHEPRWNPNDDLAPADYIDPVVEAYKPGVDMTLILENLKLTPDERFRKFENYMKFLEELRGAADRGIATSHRGIRVSER